MLLCSSVSGLLGPLAGPRFLYDVCCCRGPPWETAATALSGLFPDIPINVGEGLTVAEGALDESVEEGGRCGHTRSREPALGVVRFRTM
jgi:hypothetical protein